MVGKMKDLEALFDKRRDEDRHGKRDEREREKPSWRELDKRRDRAGSVDPDRDREKTPTLDRYQSAQAQKELKAQLDGLFADPAGASLRQAVIGAADKAGLEEALRALLDAKGALPTDDPLLLERALDVRKDALLGAVVDAVGEHLRATDDVRRKMFVLKLRGKARTTFDKKVASRIRQILDEHGGA